jgi:hypothetical protein
MVLKSGHALKTLYLRS